MSVVNSFSVIVKNAEPEAFNLGSVTQAPRSAAARDLEADAVHGVDRRLVGLEADDEIPDRQEGHRSWVIFERYWLVGRARRAARRR